MVLQQRSAVAGAKIEEREDLRSGLAVARHVTARRSAGDPRQIEDEVILIFRFFIATVALLA
jgi:hypothetical protein